MKLANACLQTADAADSKPEDIVRAVSNLKSEHDMLRKATASFVKKQLMTMPPTTVGGVDIVGGVFPQVDRSILSDAAEIYKNAGKVCILISAGESISFIISSGSKKIDCKDVMLKVHAQFEGRGGGSQDFAQGGVRAAVSPEEVFAKFMEEVVQRLH
jgi:alanyl-tRNA synthetase